MPHLKLQALPIFVCLLFQLTFIGTYIAAVVQGHVVPDFPYISDAAAYSPESNIFAQLMNIGSLLLGIIIYIRYRHIIEIYRLYPQIGESILKHNRVAIYFGIVSCLGTSVVGNFQESNVRIVHYCGAFCAFGFGIQYFWLQAFISYRIHSYCGIRISVVHFRTVITAVSSACFIVSAITGVISHILFHGKDKTKWLPPDGGWEYHVASAIAEWTNASIFCLYILTFYTEFKNIDLRHPQLSFISNQVNL